MVIEVGSHVLVDYGGVSFVDEVLEMVAHKLLHLIWRKIGWHDSLLGPSSKMETLIHYDVLNNLPA